MPRAIEDLIIDGCLQAVLANVLGVVARGVSRSATTGERAVSSETSPGGGERQLALTNSVCGIAQRFANVL